MTTDDMFIGTEYGMREKEKQRPTVAKKKCLRMMALEEKAIQILDDDGFEDTIFIT